MIFVVKIMNECTSLLWVPMDDLLPLEIITFVQLFKHVNRYKHQFKIVQMSAQCSCQWTRPALLQNIAVYLFVIFRKKIGHSHMTR